MNIKNIPSSTDSSDFVCILFSPFSLHGTWGTEKTLSNENSPEDPEFENGFGPKRG